MAQLLDYVDALSKDIGPRPAGTEEERQAALYIADQLQSEAGFPAQIEDFTCASNFPYAKLICGVITIVFAILAMIVPVMAIPALILSIIAAVIYVMESIGRPIVTNALAKGASQNVVARYVPHGSEGRSPRSRKVVLVAHYDTGRVEPGLKKTLDGLGLPLPIIYMGGMVAVPVFLLIYLLIFAGAGRMPIILMILTIIAVIICAVPVVLEIMSLRAPFNEGANDNASGVAVMLDVASAIGNGRVSEADLAALGGDAVIHGEAAARKEDLIPEGAQLVYEASQIRSPEPLEDSEDQRLASAKAAIAALTGEPVSTRTNFTISDNLVQVHEAPIAEPAEDEIEEQCEETREALSTIPASTVEDALDNAKIDASAAAAVAKRFAESGETALPDWFVAAQLKAKKPVGEGNIHRSRYADALDNAAAQSANVLEAAAAPVVAPAPEPEPEVEVAPAMAIEEEIPAPVEAVDVEFEPAVAEAEPELEPEVANKPFTLPSFLDPWKTQADALESREEISRDVERVDVTGARIAETGMVDISDGAYIEDPEVAAGRADEAYAALGTVEHREVTLPDVDETAAPQAQMAEPAGQRAPLAVAHDQGNAAVREMLGQVPGFASLESTGQIQGLAPSRSGAMRSLRAKLPHLSGAMAPIDGEDVRVSSVSTVGSFMAAGSTGAFAPVGDELLEDIDPDDIYVDDADDSDIEENYTETGAFAGPDYMEMPKSRAGGFFSRFGFGRKKNKEVETTPQEWLDVDDSFDAREVGKSRGGWESFQNESADFNASADQDFVEGDGFYDDYVDDYEDDFDDFDSFGRGKWRGGAFSRLSMGRVDTKSSAEEDERTTAAALEEDIETPAEIKQIYKFRNPNYTTEVWFVALGAQANSSDGINAFLAEHASELRGAVVVDLQALGAGALSMVTEEGGLRKAIPSSRMSRFIKKASSASGVAVDNVKLPNAVSAASTAILSGTQGLHLVGIENGAIALAGSPDDVAENIDAATLEDNAAFVAEFTRAF